MPLYKRLSPVIVLCHTLGLLACDDAGSDSAGSDADTATSDAGFPCQESHNDALVALPLSPDAPSALAEAGHDGGVGDTRRAAVELGRWDFEGGSEGWTGTRACEQGNCFLATPANSKLWHEVPGYQKQRPYRLRCKIKGDGAFMGRVFSHQDWREYTAVLRSSETSHSFDVWAGADKLAFVDDVVMEEIDFLEQAAYSDDIIRDLGLEVPFFTEPARLRYLGNTIRQLEAGHTISVVFLGDSLAADTYRGQWDALIRRKYPKASVDIHLTAIGSTGVDWYSKSGRLGEFVDQFRPTVVYIGGISNGVNVASWTSVIRTLQSTMPGVEIIAGSNTIGVENDPASSEVIQQIAQQTQVAFFDAAAAWRAYNNGLKPSDWKVLARDPGVHQNYRGFEVLARLFASFIVGPLN